MQTENKDTVSLGNIAQRAVAPTPSFWKKLQKIAVIVGVVAGTIVSGGIAAPAAVVSIAGYVATAAGVVVTVAQLTKEDSTDGTAPAK